MAPVSLAVLAALIVKHHNLHEGLWNAYVGPGSWMSTSLTDHGSGLTSPGFVLTLGEIGIARVSPEERNENTVDAAEVNPRSKVEVVREMPRELTKKVH